MKSLSVILASLFVSAAAFAQEPTLTFEKLVRFTQQVCPQAVQANDFSSCQQNIYFNKQVKLLMIPTELAPKNDTDNGNRNLEPGQPDPGPLLPVTWIHWYAKLDQNISTPRGNFIVRIEGFAHAMKGVQNTQSSITVTVSILSSQGSLLAQVNQYDAQISGVTLRTMTQPAANELIYSEVLLLEPMPPPMPGITGNN